MGPFTAPSIFVVFGKSVGFYHSQNKTQHQSSADKNHKIGRKKGHDKGIGVFQFIGRYEHQNPESQEKASNKDQKSLAYPPENIEHEALFS
ncbi:MAG: hypothetical protein JRD04_04420 [Deltaproteobacteria bacterium]|nr:hypothetical protein [Deltaproteobacteria bacterium]